MSMTTSALRHAALAGLIVLLPAVAQAALYRWVDKDGNVHFSDKIPAEAAREDTRKEAITPQGDVKEIVQEKSKTPEQLAEEKRQRELREAEEERIRQQRQHDRLLVSTYDSVDSLEMARDGKINALESQILVASGQIKEREDLMERFRARAAELERSGEPVNEKLQQDMALTQDQIDRNRERIEELRAEQQRIRDKYAADIARYKMLKGIE